MKLTDFSVMFISQAKLTQTICQLEDGLVWLPNTCFGASVPVIFGHQLTNSQCANMAVVVIFFSFIGIGKIDERQFNKKGLDEFQG